MTYHVIVNKQEPELLWSNTDGWVEQDFDIFTTEETKTLNLPVGGEWVEIVV